MSERGRLPYGTPKNGLYTFRPYVYRGTGRDDLTSMMNCCDICPFSPTCEEEEDQVSHSYAPTIRVDRQKMNEAYMASREGIQYLPGE